MPLPPGLLPRPIAPCSKTGEQVALKVQRPGIERQVARDMTLIRDIARLVSATQFGQRYNVLDLAEEFADALNAELDFTIEAGYTDQLRRNLAHCAWYDPDQLVVPKIYWDLTNSTLMTMEWLEGRPILKADVVAVASRETAKVTRNEATTLLFRAFFKQYFVDGFFHADPHPATSFTSTMAGWPCSTAA
jgi:ubiquinone biosynthesis protein